MKGMILMPHYNAYDSFKTKKSIEKKQRAKERAFGKKSETIDNFVIDSCEEYGVVIEVRYDDAYILYNGDVVLAKLRKDINLVCNQVVFPGDKVDLEKVNETYVINHLLNRTSILSRTKKDSTRLNDVGSTKNIASNVDLAVIVVAAKEPPLHPKFIDRYLMILQNSNIPAIICLNKCDLKTDEDEEILATYRDLGIDVIETSTYGNIGIDELKARLIINKLYLLETAELVNHLLLMLLWVMMRLKQVMLAIKVNEEDIQQQLQNIMCGKRILLLLIHLV